MLEIIVALIALALGLFGYTRRVKRKNRKLEAAYQKEKSAREHNDVIVELRQKRQNEKPEKIQEMVYEAKTNNFDDFYSDD